MRRLALVGIEYEDGPNGTLALVFEETMPDPPAELDGLWYPSPSGLRLQARLPSVLLGLLRAELKTPTAEYTDSQGVRRRIEYRSGRWGMPGDRIIPD